MIKLPIGIPLGCWKDKAKKPLTMFVMACILVIYIVLNAMQVAEQTGRNLSSVLKFPAYAANL